MKNVKNTLSIFLMLISGATGLYAQCYDEVEYVPSKNIGGTDLILVSNGAPRRSVAQTYHYSGSGVVSSVKVYGENPHWHNITVKVGIYHVDVNNRPTSMIAQTTAVWNPWLSSTNANFPNTPVSQNFALVVEYSDGAPIYIKHTGNDGVGEDLSSYRVSSSSNWYSLGLGGDLYIEPFITNSNNANFTATTNCVPVGGSVTFTDNSAFTKSKMFNQITEPGYSGGSTLYSWNFGGLGTSILQNPTFTFNTPGVHAVTLTTTIDDWNGATCQDTYTINVSVGLSVSGVGTNLTCYESGDGEIELTGSFGAVPYTYSVDDMPYQAGTNFSELSAGSYNLSITDAIGCSVSGNSAILLTEPNQMSVALPINATLATCGNSDGAFVASASGGNGTISYSIDNSNFQVNGSFTGLAADAYTIYLMDSDQGCIDSTTTVAINSTTSPVLTLIQYLTIACNGFSDGAITVLGSGGTGALQYSIDGGETWQVSGVFSGLTAGNYTPMVKDVVGCIGSMGEVTISEPTVAQWTANQTPTSCYGIGDGQINVGPIVGGTGTMTYSIFGLNFQSSPNFSGLAAGLYTISVKDAAGCLTSGTITVDQPAPIVVNVDASVNLSCFESGDGEIHASATGGNGDYVYALNSTGEQTSNDFYNLESGVYIIQVSDGNNCIGNTSVILGQPSQIVASVVTGNSTCGNFNGNILVIASGGSGSGYQYNLNEGISMNGTGNFVGLHSNEYGIHVTDAAGCEANFEALVADSDGPSIATWTNTNVSCHNGDDGSITINSTTGGTGLLSYSLDGTTFQTSPIFPSLTAGIYTVIAKDANGCTGEVSVTVNQPNGFTILINKTDVTCYGSSNGTLTVLAGGGSGTLAYSLNGIIFQSSSLFENLSPGTYTVTVKDAGGCEGTASIFIGSANQLHLYAGVLRVSCHGAADGAINATAFGGTGAIQFSLDGVNYQSQGYFNNLAGTVTYTVYARDANGCVITHNYTVIQPQNLLLQSDVIHVSCAGGNNGVINLTMTGGTSPYSYSWSNFETTEDIFNLAAGAYSVNVTDNNECVVTTNLVVNAPSNPLIINGTVLNASGASNSDGNIDVTVTGGTAPYSFSWNNGSSSEDLTAVLPGTYYVTMIDANGCEQISFFTVDITVGIEQVFKLNTLKVYPNPTAEKITIDLGIDALATKIVLVDPAGKVVFEDFPNSNNFDVNVEKYAEGTYLLNIYVAQEIVVKRIVITR
jgi:hypothetical protein